MGLQLRRGEYGEYWGNDYNSSNALNLTQMQLNSKYIFKGLGNKGFTKNAICAILGNMQSESSINPGRWQNDNVGRGPAYGLVQWDPFTKYTKWCSGDPSTMDNNIARIVFEIENGLQWIKKSAYPLTFWEFAKSTKSPYYLAMAFVYNYERPADPNQPARGEQAEYWWNYLAEITPKPIPQVRVQNTRKWLCARNRRINIIR